MRSKFSISFKKPSKVCRRKGQSFKEGTIQIGGFKETFLSCLTYWGAADYENQWAEGLARIETGQKRTLLVTTLGDPKERSMVEVWSLYAQPNGKVKIHNDWLFFHNRKTIFDEKNPYKHIRLFKSKTNDGKPISGWVLAKNDIMAGSEKK